MNAMMHAFKNLAKNDSEVAELLREAEDLRTRMEQNKAALRAKAEKERDEQQKAEDREYREKKAVKNRKKQLWGWKVQDCMWDFYYGIAFSDDWQDVHQHLKSVYPDATNITIEVVDCSEEFTVIGEYHE